jgi:hypothetical protein
MASPVVPTNTPAPQELEAETPTLVNRFARYLSDPEESVAGESQEVQGEQPAASDPAEQPDVQAEAEPGQEDEATAPPRYTVKVDGQEVEVDLEELKKGYSFSRHNTQQSQKIAEERKAFESEREALRKQVAEYAELLPKLRQGIDSELAQYANVDWDKLASENPSDFTFHRAKYNTLLERHNAATAEEARVQEAQRKEALQSLEQDRDREMSLLVERIPEWKDQAVMRKEASELAAFASEVGFTPEDLADIYDHRAFVVLRDAMRYRQMMAKAKSGAAKVADPKVRPAVPTAPSGRKPVQTDADKARTRLKKTGRDKDAIAALEARLNARK